MALLRTRTDAGVRLIRDLSDPQLGLTARPPRSIAEFVESVMIGHYTSHQAGIEAKLRPPV